MKMPFKYKFILSFVTIEIFFITLIVFFNFSSLNRLSKSLIEEKIEIASQLLSKLIETPLIVYDLATIDNTLESFSHVKNVSAVRVSDNNNKLIAHIDDDNPLYKKIFASKEDNIEIEERTFRMSDTPIQIDGYTLGNIKIIFEITESLEAIKQNRNLTFFLILCEILVSMSIAYLIGYRLTRALSILTKSAQKIAKEDQTTIPHIKNGGSEIAVLSQTLALMQKKIAKRNKTLTKLTITDTLTNLYNRRHFNDVFYVELNRVKRDRKIFCLLSLDVDFFKMYNDTYGHQKGDDVLSSIAQSLLQKMKRSSDMAFRMGGEEFSAIYAAEDERGASKIAESIRKHVEDRRIEHKPSTVCKYVTVSIGVVFVDFLNNPNLEITQGNFYKASDDLLYHAKNSGRNRVIIKECTIC